MRAVVVDLDDTLYPEQAYVRSGFRAVAELAAERLGVPAQRGCAELEELFEQGVRGDTFDRWLERHGAADDAVLRDQLVARYRDHAPRIEPFPEAAALLERLGRRYALGLLSDGYVAVQNAKLDALGLRRHFDAVLITDELGRDAWKPSPRGFAELLRRLGGIAASEAVYVSDNPAKDFLGARRAGMRSVRVRREGGIYAALEPPTPEHAPDAQVAGLDEVEAALERLVN